MRGGVGDDGMGGDEAVGGGVEGDFFEDVFLDPGLGVFQGGFGGGDVAVAAGLFGDFVAVIVDEGCATAVEGQPA